MSARGGFRILYTALGVSCDKLHSQSKFYKYTAHKLYIAKAPNTPRVSAMALTVDLKQSKHAAAIVRQVACGRLGMEEVESTAANLLWYERAISVAEARCFGPQQRINMIPGMHEMAKKMPLARALNRLRRCFPEEFDFVPMTWSLPLELEAFKQHCSSCEAAAAATLSPPPVYIVKPSAGCQGKGIYLASSAEQLRRDGAAVVQQYLSKPLLLGGLKFDLRCYVLVLSVAPLVAYLHRDGMARFATSAYAPPDASNLENVHGT